MDFAVEMRSRNAAVAPKRDAAGEGGEPMTDQGHIVFHGRVCARLAGVAVQRAAAVLMAVVVVVALGCATPTPAPLAEAPALTTRGAHPLEKQGIISRE